MNKPQINSLCLFIENISKRIPKDNYKAIISNIFYENKQNITLTIISNAHKENNMIDNAILKAIDKQRNILLLNNTIILFEFYNNKDSSIDTTISPLLLFNEIVIYQYSPAHYHLNNINKSISTNIILKPKLISYYNNLSPAYVNKSINIICLTSKYALIKISYDHSNIKTIIELYTIISKEHINTIKLLNNPQYSHSAFFEVDSSNFILMNQHHIMLFEKGFKYSFIIHKINLSFSKSPIPILYHNIDLCFISSQRFIYRINTSSKQQNSICVFGDLSLNFNNEKYKEMIEIMKIILYYIIEIQKENIDTVDKQPQIIKLFEEYDLHSYVENLLSVISEDNASFFINYNLNSAKLQAIIIYCAICHRYDFLHKVIEILKSNEGNSLLFVIFMEDVLMEFYRTFESIDYKAIIKEINIMLFKEDQKIIESINDYIKND